MTVKVRLSGPEHEVQAVLDALTAALNLGAPSRPYANRRDPGVRVYVEVNSTPQPDRRGVRDRG